MDAAISALFAVFLQGTQAAGEVVADSIGASMNLEPTAVVVEHQGRPVSFSHQMWRIQSESVCRERRHDLAGFAECTHAAQRLFRSACDDLRRNPRGHPLYEPMTRMYCTAAAGFKPTQASIEWAGPGDNTQPATTEESEDCRLAKAALLTDRSAAARAQRREACGY